MLRTSQYAAIMTTILDGSRGGCGRNPRADQIREALGGHFSVIAFCRLLAEHFDDSADIGFSFNPAHNLAAKLNAVLAEHENAAFECFLNIFVCRFGKRHVKGTSGNPLEIFKSSERDRIGA
jgi:hypothetical protein